MKPTVLLYNVNNQKTIKALRMFSVKLGYRIRTVDDSMHQIPILFLANGLPEQLEQMKIKGEVAEDVKFEDSMIVFAAFTEAKLNQFLNQFRASKVPNIPLKAIMTDTNMMWNSVQLLDELKKEDAVMHLKTAEEINKEINDEIDKGLGKK